MRRALSSVAVLTALGLTSCTNLAFADEAGEGTFGIRVLGCELPIPSSYSVHGRELGRIVISRDSGKVGRIMISRFAGYSEMYQVSGERAVGGLIVADLVNHREWRTPDYDMTIIRDDEYVVALMGAARELTDSLVEACTTAQE